MRKLLVITLIAIPMLCHAQFSRLGKNVQWGTTLQGSAGSGDVAPFWFTSNRYGLGPSEANSGLIRANIQRNVEADSLRNWRLGYGLDLAGAFSANHTRAVIQQAFVDVQWKMLRLTVGQKERVAELKNAALSAGGLTLGTNARPIPQIRLEMPDFWAVPGTKNWFAFKAHIAYGLYTDNAWQRNFNAGTPNVYTKGSKFHSKALFIRIGNEQKFPLILSGGLEMACQFGGDVWNVFDRKDHESSGWNTHQNLDDGFSSYWHAFIPTGNDVTDGNYSNAAGNHLGSWHARLDWKGKGWGAAFYLEHFFEDHSMMFLQYAWNDMQYGFEINPPKNRFVSSLVYEYLTMTDQTGPIYHDKTANLPEQISGGDNYYNHNIYGAWQHAGYVMGNPLLLSPLYNRNNAISVNHNRITSHHIGITGQPFEQLKWRFLYTHEYSLGTYDRPLLDPQRGNYYLLDVTYMPKQIPALAITGSYGRNSGELLGTSNGAMITLSYTGLFNKTH